MTPSAWPAGRIVTFAIGSALSLIDSDESVSGFVHGDSVLLVGKQHVRTLTPAQDDPVTGFVEVGLAAEHLAIGAHRHDGSLVDQVRQVCP